MRSPFNRQSKKLSRGRRSGFLFEHRRKARERGLPHQSDGTPTGNLKGTGKGAWAPFRAPAPSLIGQVPIPESCRGLPHQSDGTPTGNLKGTGKGAWVPFRAPAPSLIGQVPIPESCTELLTLPGVRVTLVNRL
jgi:hypothetical protein